MTGETGLVVRLDLEGVGRAVCEPFDDCCGACWVRREDFTRVVVTGYQVLYVIIIYSSAAIVSRCRPG